MKFIPKGNTPGRLPEVGEVWKWKHDNYIYMRLRLHTNDKSKFSNACLNSGGESGEGLIFDFMTDGDVNAMEMLNVELREV